MFKTPPPTRFAALPPSHIMSKTPPLNRFAGFLQANAPLKTPRPARLAALPSSRFLLSRFRCRTASQLRSSRRDHWRSSLFVIQATRRLSIGHLWCLSVDHSSCLVGPTIISSRTHHRSAAATDTTRTPVDYGFGLRRLVTTTPRPPVLHPRVFAPRWYVCRLPPLPLPQRAPLLCNR